MPALKNKIDELELSVVKKSLLKSNPHKAIEEIFGMAEGTIRVLNRLEGDHQILIDLLADRASIVQTFKRFKPEELMTNGSYTEFKFIMHVQVLDAMMQQALQVIAKSKMKKVGSRNVQA